MVSPAVAQVADEAAAGAAGAEGCCAAAGDEDGKGGAATFSCTFTDGRTAAAAAGAGGGLGCAAAGLAALSLSPEPPGTVQPMGVHWIPCTRPSPFGATLLNKLIVASMSSNAHAPHVSVTVAMVSVPVIGLWMEICLLQMGLLLGLAGLFIRRCERATMASPSVLVTPQEPDKDGELAVLWGKCNGA